MAAPALDQVVVTKIPNIGVLISKLAHVMGEVERIPKHGHNAHFGYDYATEADITAALRQKLAAVEVMVIPSVTSVRREGTLTTLDMLFTFYDGETGAQLAVPWAGVGEDKSDKGIWKAMTGAVKYLLLKTFLIPTGDDPEADDKPQRKATRQVPTKAAPSKPAAAKDATITEEQRHELDALRAKAGWPPEIAKAMLKRHGFESSKEITAAKFDAIKKELELGVLENAPF